MRTALAALVLAAGLGLICCEGAAAFPVAAGPIGQSATAASDVQQAQYSERHGHHHVVKCYRDFVVGTYACHRYRYW